MMSRAELCVQARRDIEHVDTSEVTEIVADEVDRRHALGTLAPDVHRLCPKIYARPQRDRGERKYCLNELYTVGDRTYSRCMQHIHEDASFGAPLCSNGKVHPNHKRGIHPAVCPKDPASGLCYFCLKAAERAYTDALLAGEEPTGLVVAGASLIATSTQSRSVSPATLLSGDYLAAVARATRDLGLTAEELSFAALEKCYKLEPATAAEACAFLYNYLSHA